MDCIALTVEMQGSDNQAFTLPQYASLEIEGTAGAMYSFNEEECNTATTEKANGLILAGESTVTFYVRTLDQGEPIPGRILVSIGTRDSGWNNNPARQYNTAPIDTSDGWMFDIPFDSAAPLPACQDGVDNDGDGETDHPNDPDCDSPSDDDESTDVNPPDMDDPTMGSGAGLVSELLVLQTTDGQAVGMFETVVNTNKASCSTAHDGNQWAFSLENAAGQNMYSLLLAANAQEKSVFVYGFGDCHAWGDRERPHFIRIVD
ncbi:MAG: hypothetical protein AAF515_16715 [Pseudomonadota bacterium]